ncbi:hypothetical protein REH76_05480 [Photobacterium damselae]
MIIKRVITDVLSVGVVISYLELKHIHYFSEQSEINNSINITPDIAGYQPHDKSN